MTLELVHVLTAAHIKSNRLNDSLIFKAVSLETLVVSTAEARSRCSDMSSEMLQTHENHEIPKPVKLGSREIPVWTIEGGLLWTRSSQGLKVWILLKHVFSFSRNFWHHQEISRALTRNGIWCRAYRVWRRSKRLAFDVSFCIFAFAMFARLPFSTKQFLEFFFLLWTCKSTKTSEAYFYCIASAAADALVVSS